MRKRQRGGAVQETPPTPRRRRSRGVVEIDTQAITLSEELQKQINSQINSAIRKSPQRIEVSRKHDGMKFRVSMKQVEDASNRQIGTLKDIIPYVDTTLKNKLATGARLFKVKGVQLRVLINLDSKLFE